MSNNTDKGAQMNNNVTTAWAICDTDGGRREPFVLLQCIRASEADARDMAKYRRLDPQWYPIRKIEIRILDDGIEIRILEDGDE